MNHKSNMTVEPTPQDRGMAAELLLLISLPFGDDVGIPTEFANKFYESCPAVVSFIATVREEARRDGIEAAARLLDRFSYYEQAKMVRDHA